MLRSDILWIHESKDTSDFIWIRRKQLFETLETMNSQFFFQ